MVLADMSTDVPAGQWTVDTLKASIDQRFVEMYRLLDERKETSDEAGRVALAAQQTAMRTALEAAEKAVTTALVSAEKAVNKAEIAADKRFDATNEFRQQLNDQVATFLPRSEASVLFTAIDSKLQEHITRADESFTLIRSQLDSSRGASAGVWRLIAIGIAIVGAAVAVYTATR
jgi:SMC interacting uncharacterized protein involved in chromosome segregation